jgi:group I intron endonuclease
VPYLNDVSGVYKIVNVATNKCYVGQSVGIKKRVKEHFRLLRNNKHTNPRLQNSFNKYGENNFTWDVEAECEDSSDIDMIEEAFINGDASFDEPIFFNIANFAKAPMRGKVHTEETKEKIRVSKKISPHVRTEEYLKKLSIGQIKRAFSNPEYVAKIRHIVDNPHMSYAERGRMVGMDTSTVRKVFLRYSNLQGTI